MDDFTHYGNSFEEALDNLEKVVKRCKQTHISLNTKKCHMMMQEGIVLGHFISAARIQVDPSKVEVIQNLCTPKTQKEVRRFIGYVGYYHCFIEDFSKIASPLFLLLSKDAEFNWSDTCDTTLAELKKLVSQDPVLRGPQWKLPFQISSDTLDTAIGAMLGQE